MPRPNAARRRAHRPSTLGRVIYGAKRAWDRLILWRDLTWFRLATWRNRTFGDRGHRLGLFVVGIDLIGFLFRVALLIAAILVVLHAAVGF